MSSPPTEEKLRARIVDLETELKERESDLKRFRDELGLANERLQNLITRLETELKLAHVIQKILVPI